MYSAIRASNLIFPKDCLSSLSFHIHFQISLLILTNWYCFRLQWNDNSLRKSWHCCYLNFSTACARDLPYLGKEAVSHLSNVLYSLCKGYSQLLLNLFLGTWFPGLGRSPGGGHGNPLQYSCLENAMDRGLWLAIVHRSQRVECDWAQHLIF